MLILRGEVSILNDVSIWTKSCIMNQVSFIYIRSGISCICAQLHPLNKSYSIISITPEFMCHFEIWDVLRSLQWSACTHQMLSCPMSADQAKVPYQWLKYEFVMLRSCIQISSKHSAGNIFMWDGLSIIVSVQTHIEKSSNSSSTGMRFPKAW